MDLLLAQDLYRSVQALSRINVGEGLYVPVLDTNIETQSGKMSNLFEDLAPRTNLVLFQLLDALAYLAFRVIPNREYYAYYIGGLLVQDLDEVRNGQHPDKGSFLAVENGRGPNTIVD